MSRRLSGRLPVEQAFASPAKQIRIPLNDDDEERHQRRKERNIMQEAVRNRLSFGVTSTPRRQAIDEDASEEINNNAQRLHATPKTPRNVGTNRRDRRASMMTPMRRVVVGDFEEWMKMANDNVCSSLEVLIAELMATRKSMPQIHGTLHSLTTSMI